MVPFLLLFSFAFTPHHAETKSSLGSSQQMTNSQSILSSSTKDRLRIIQKKYDVPGIAVEIVAYPPNSVPSAQDRINNGIVRVLGSDEAIVKEDVMGVFGGFCNCDPMTYRRITEGQDPEISAEGWFDRVGRD
ncbi:hypothetical protein I203_104840 [Kwoniella mangroviensis CBS 8507]|uniref:uncharacterized protein n=1 Tax=Kwoniella mangroviensis CBS 8507 TaxID=1296122 RepID=UPI00080D62DD|nr:uncharacterized protein I203_00218 [Kwoniella mangroviensis CBS 8507]OCF70087.1 hypothetical protein I203_00218 [Kwoniella mangroviensis CBS 8507]